jgi:hypothetical protein
MAEDAGSASGCRLEADGGSEARMAEIKLRWFAR